MYTITKEFSFEAAHHLVGLPSEHKCGQVHGHSYKVIFELRSEKLDEHGFVKDYGELKNIKEFLDRNFDHKDLNIVFNGQNASNGMDMNPTAENIAEALYKTFKYNYPQLYSVTVKETEGTSAKFSL